MKNAFTCSIIMIIGIFVVLGCGALANKNTNAPENTATVKTEPTKQAPPENTAEPSKSVETTGGVTLANFNKIKTGMKYEEVVKILGREGEVLSESEISNYKTIMYKWDGDEGGFGANMNAMFQNGKLIQKSQFGLK